MTSENTDHEDREPVERLKLARKLAGLTQENAARALNVTGRTYARWERGETMGWLSEVDRIAEVFGVAPEELAPKREQLDVGAVERIEVQLAEMRELLEQLVTAQAKRRR